MQSTIEIKSFENSEVFRKIITIGRRNQEEVFSEFVIYKEQGVYSESYRSLLKPYFLAF